ncbi:MAG TPA: hypothetical protein H9720_01050 [Candidatus Limosilactobacillus intestinigallinarum]|nr:hypothetical protein [Candidatus Limosilactobacillus intestinigallinarum]
MTETKNNDERFPEVKPTKPGNDTAYIAPIIGKLGYDTRRPWLFGLGTSPNNGVDFHVFLSFDGLNFDDNDIDKIWNGGTADRVKKEVDSATAEIPAAVSAANSAVSAAESAVAASKVNSDAIVAQSEAISEAKSAMDSATAEIQQTAANAASDAAKIRADVAQVQSEVDTAKAANSASVEALKSDIDTAKQDLANVHDSLTKAQSAVEQNQKLINDSVAKITSDVSATKQDLATVHDSLTKAQAAAEQNQKAINDSIAEINANVDATNQDLAGVRKDLTKAQSDITANQKAIDDNVAQISDDITQDRKDIADVRQGLTKAQSDIIANQKAVNDNVAQINSDIEQDRKDIASAQQANADTVKQLDAYSKQAQEQGKTIKAVQDKQDGFSATLADVQGNVSQVSDKVSGLSASLKDAQDNVASVKAQADQLSATLTDHSKSIAILTASAKELSSTLEDADGRLSKVEQTAQTNSSTLSDVQGDLSQVKQNATKLVSTLKDAQGNISTLQQKADSVSTQLATAQGDIATLQTGVDSVKATLTSHDKSIHTLQADSKSLKDSMADAQGDISTLSKTATDVTSELEDHTGRLSKVEQNAAKQATTLSDLQGNLSQVEQKADSNTATISSINKNAMQDRGVITDTKTSFDSLTQLGTYSIKASGLPKMPEQHYGTLVVSGSAGSGWLSQQFVADTTGNVYTRVFSNNAWSAWKQGGSQDAINQVKQTADSNSATIRNVQGDVSTLKQTATGIKSTLASHEGDIHTLQADSKSLKDSMTNAQGDISTLQKSATSLDSEMKDHAGRLSKVEQNAATQATTLSDLQGNLTQVKQQADGLVTTLKDAQGSITQIQQKADGTLAQLKSAQGDIASLQTNITGIKATLVSHEGDIHTLQADSRMLKDDMKDAQGNISSLQKSSTKLDSEMSSQDGRLSKVEQTAKEHTSTISSLGKKVDSNGGGVNLLTNTQLFDYNWTWDSIGHSFTNGVLTLDGNDDATSRMFQQLTDNDTTGETFSVSFNARISTDCDSTSVEVDAGPYDATKRINVTSKDFQHYKAENWQWNSSSIFFSLYVNSGKIDITNLKLEYGAVATPYSLAPADLATISQVKQTADGITTTLKNVQGDVDQVTQKANGTSEQLADVQGDVTNIQKDVSGLKQTTADNAGNIHTLQSDSKSLHDSMQDAQGDISTLKKTSTDVTSELKDHAGRISKTEQTASTLVNEFADQQGHLSRVEQTAQGTQQTVANQQGQINNIKTDAAGIHQTLTGQGNQIANINVTLSGLNSKYEGVSGDLGKLKGQVTTNSTQIAQNKKEIDLKANQDTVDNLTGEVSQNKAQFTVQAGQISSKVSGIETSLANANSRLDSITSNGGGRNLWIDSKSFQHSITNAPKVGWNTDSDGMVTAHITGTGGFYGEWQNIYANNTEPFAIGDSETFSVEMKGTGTITIGREHDFEKAVTLTNTWTRYSVSGVVKDANRAHIIYNESGKDCDAYVRLPMVEKGVVAHDWQPAPEDTNAKITANSTAIDQTDKKISLKADQTEVDKIKGTASQNSSRLDVMAGEIKSKVTSTDVNNIVDSKGYATTSTVQSLITQKAGTINESITNLDAKYSAKDGVNIQRGTGDCSFPVASYNATVTIENYDDHTKMFHVKGAGGFYTSYNADTSFVPTVGETYTVSADVKGGGTTSGDFFKYEGADSCSLGTVTLTDTWQRISNTVHIGSVTGQWIFYLNNHAGDFYVKHIKIERGSVATPWTPAPSDNATVTQLQSITASVDGVQSNVTNLKSDTSSKLTQLSNTFQSKIGDAQIAINDLKDKTLWKSTDSVDLNNVVTQQKIFVKGGSNLPPGSYWWYVQVESGYGSRIVQYAVSDRDNIHYSRQYDGSKWSAWSQGATESEITQLRDDINLRVVKKGDLLSQINIDAGHTLIQSNKIYLAAGSVVFSDNAFIPSAAIENLDASKLTFYGPYNTYATIGSSVKQYDDDKQKNTINLQYNGGVEVHASNELGSILTMHDDTIRLAVKSQVYGSGSGQPLNQQYSGVWFGSNYTLMNTVDKEGKTTGWSIGSNKSGSNNDYRAYLYDNSTSTQPNYGVGIGTTRFDVYAGNSQLFLGPDKAELRGNDHATVHGNDHTFIEGGDQQIYMHNGEIDIGNPNNIGSATGVHLQVFGWATYNGYVEAMGFNQKSTLSSKTRIQPLDTAKALATINATDLTTFQYKAEIAEGMTKRHAGPIIDDVHDVAQYQTPDAFVAENRQGRSDGDIVGFLMGAVQELSKQLNELKEEVKSNE